MSIWIPKSLSDIPEAGCVGCRLGHGADIDEYDAVGDKGQHFRRVLACIPTQGEGKGEENAEAMLDKFISADR